MNNEKIALIIYLVSIPWLMLASCMYGNVLRSRGFSAFEASNATFAGCLISITYPVFLVFFSIILPYYIFMGWVLFLNTNHRRTKGYIGRPT